MTVCRVSGRDEGPRGPDGGPLASVGAAGKLVCAIGAAQDPQGPGPLPQRPRGLRRCHPRRCPSSPAAPGSVGCYSGALGQPLRGAPGGRRLYLMQHGLLLMWRSHAVWASLHSRGRGEGQCVLPAPPVFCALCWLLLMLECASSCLCHPWAPTERGSRPSSSMATGALWSAHRRGTPCCNPSGRAAAPSTTHVCQVACRTASPALLVPSALWLLPCMSGAPWLQVPPPTSLALSLALPLAVCSLFGAPLSWRAEAERLLQESGVTYTVCLQPLPQKAGALAAGVGQGAVASSRG